MNNIAHEHARGYLANILRKLGRSQTRPCPPPALPDKDMMRELRKDVRPWVDYIIKSAGIPAEDIPPLLVVLSASIGMRGAEAPPSTAGAVLTLGALGDRFIRLTRVADPPFFRALAEEVARILRNGGATAARLQQLVSGERASASPEEDARMAEDIVLQQILSAEDPSICVFYEEVAVARQLAGGGGGPIQSPAGRALVLFRIYDIVSGGPLPHLFEYQGLGIDLPPHLGSSIENPATYGLSSRVAALNEIDTPRADLIVRVGLSPWPEAFAEEHHLVYAELGVRYTCLRRDYANKQAVETLTPALINGFRGRPGEPL